MPKPPKEVFPREGAEHAPAFAVVTFWPPGAPYATLENIWVDRTHLRQGLGGALFQQVKAEAKRRRITHIFTHPMPGKRQPGTTIIEPIPAERSLEYAQRVAELDAFNDAMGFRPVPDDEADEKLNFGTYVVKVK